MPGVTTLRRSTFAAAAMSVRGFVPTDYAAAVGAGAEAVMLGASTHTPAAGWKLPTVQLPPSRWVPGTSATARVPCIRTVLQAATVPKLPFLLWAMSPM